MARCKVKETTSAQLKSCRSTLRIRHVEHVRDTEKRNAGRIGEAIERQTHESKIIPGDATTMWDFLMDFH